MQLMCPLMARSIVKTWQPTFETSIRPSYDYPRPDPLEPIHINSSGRSPNTAHPSPGCRPCLCTKGRMAA